MSPSVPASLTHLPLGSCCAALPQTGKTRQLRPLPAPPPLLVTGSITLHGSGLSTHPPRPLGQALPGGCGQSYCVSLLAAIPLPGTGDSVSVCRMSERMGTTAALQMGGANMNAPVSLSRNSSGMGLALREMKPGVSRKKRTGSLQCPSSPSF